ncbi:MAG: MBL fold metallo-hydrolase [Chloroflexota bacterium]|nr:MBL fold metallo-hydrolase [Chloroflexota bacterium]
MFEFRSYASGSSGNQYRLTCPGSEIMIDAGLRFSDIRKAYEFQISKMDGCLITHEHMDHARSAAKLMQAGVDCYMTAGTAEALGLSGHRLKIIQAREQFAVGAFRVMPFRTIHDAAEPVGFLIASGPQKLLFATDTCYIPHRFHGLTHIAIEANYDLSILDKNIEAGIYPAANRDYVRRSHMSIDQTREMLLSNDLSEVREIWLLHLSNANSDADRFQREIEELTGKPCRVAI